MLGIGLLCLAVFVPPLYGTMEANNCGFDDRLLEVNKTERSGWDPDKLSFFDWSEYEIGSTGVISVPYYFNPQPSRAVRSAVEAGLRYVEENMSCIKFKETRKDLNKKQVEMTIATKDICRGEGFEGEVSPGSYSTWSHNGQLASWNKRIYLTMDHAPCLRYRYWSEDSIEKFTRWYQIFVHELFHVFGIAHTMRRTDRDNYINVLYENIPKKRHAQYEKDALIPVPNIPYECNSIMHYDSMTEEGFDGPNFVAIDPRTCKFNGKEPTDNDWIALKYNTCAKLKGFSD